MRLLILLAGVLLANVALADDSKEFKVNRLEVTAAAPQPVEEVVEEKEVAPTTKAQDYNSSRSNTTSRVDTTDAQDYNSSRSNNINAADSDDDDGDKDDAVEKTKSDVKDQRK